MGDERECWIFEPHLGFGTPGPDEMTEWPFGYISDANTKIGVPMPLFELSPVIGADSPDAMLARALKIAAAPDLLRACQRVLRHCDEPVSPDNSEWDGLTAVEMVRAAVAKATGETA